MEGKVGPNTAVVRDELEACRYKRATYSEVVEASRHMEQETFVEGIVVVVAVVEGLV